MRYTVRTGIIYRMIVDEHFLISFGEAIKTCPAIQQINKGAAYYWKLLEQGMDSEEMLDIAAEEFGVGREIMKPGLERFLRRLEEKNYVVPEENCRDQ